MSASRLFEPIQVGALRLPHRMLMAPMTRCRAGAGNTVTEATALYYAQRAGAGLIISEATQIAPEAQGYPGTPGIHDEAQERAWRRVTERVHQAGGRIFLQLWHVGRISHPLIQPGGALPVAPSAIAPQGNAETPAGRRPFVTPRALSEQEIPGVVAKYAAAARRARAAGFDGVEVHGANGYLIEQFLLDGTNRRSDGYGGSLPKRARFLLEVTRAVISVWGAERVGVRLSPRGTFNDMDDSDRRATFGYAAERLDELGLAYLHLVDPLPGCPFDNPACERFTPLLRSAFRGPLVVNGGFTRDSAAAALERGEADLVAFGIPFLANPDLPERFALDAPLNAADRSTFYGGGARGYTDYPCLGAEWLRGAARPPSVAG